MSCIVIKDGPHGINTSHAEEFTAALRRLPGEVGTGHRSAAGRRSSLGDPAAGRAVGGTAYGVAREQHASYATASRRLVTSSRSPCGGAVARQPRHPARRP